MGADGDICSRALFVDNLHLKDDAQIKDAFAPFGPLESIHTKDKTKDADKAYHKMHNKKVHHHHVRIDKATTADFKEFGVKRTAPPPSPEDGELSPVSGLSPPPSPPTPQTPAKAATQAATRLTPPRSRYHSSRHSCERHHAPQGRDDDSRRNRSSSPRADDDRWGARPPSDRRHHPAHHSDRVERHSKPGSDHKRRHDDYGHRSADDLRSKRSRPRHDSDYNAEPPPRKHSKTAPIAVEGCHDEPHSTVAKRPATPSFETCSTPPPWGYSS